MYLQAQRFPGRLLAGKEGTLIVQDYVLRFAGVPEVQRLHIALQSNCRREQAGGGSTALQGSLADAAGTAAGGGNVGQMAAAEQCPEGLAFD